MRAALAVAAGLAWALAAQPRGWWVLFPLGVTALAVAVHGCRLRVRMLLGGLTGLILYAGVLTWVTDFNAPGYVGIALIQTIMLAAVVGLVPAGRGSGRWASWLGGWLALPAALVLLEAVQARFPFGGFPLPSLVYSQVDGPFMGAAPLGGSLLVTTAAATSGIALAALILMRGRRRLWVAGTAALIAGVPAVAGLVISTQSAGTLDTTIVQGGGERGVRAVDIDSMDITDRHIATADKIREPADLVLLPENVADIDGSIADSELNQRFADLARRLNTHLVVGLTEGYGDHFRNVALMWEPDGDRSDRYEKKHRVPFGEYLPARGLIERISDDTRFVPRDAIIGEGEPLFDASGTPIGVVISYEMFFSHHVDEAIDAGGQILLVPTNASSYVTDEVPALELAAARLRAREFGRTVLMAAPTGYSAIVVPDGEVTDLSELSAETLLNETVPLRSGQTPFAHVGDAPMIGLAALVLLIPRLRFGQPRISWRARLRSVAVKRGSAASQLSQ